MTVMVLAMTNTLVFSSKLYSSELPYTCFAVVVVRVVVGCIRNISKVSVNRSVRCLSTVDRCTSSVGKAYVKRR